MEYLYFWALFMHMGKLSEIKAPVEQELKQFNRFFRETTRSSVPLLDLVMQYMIRARGKQMRPLFVFLSAKMNGAIGHDTYVAATSIELLHSATLIHDDVVDESYERRGFFSINAIWKNKIAVLSGDYLLAKGMLIAMQEKAYAFLEVISKTVKEMSEGEMNQLERSRKLDIDEETYFDIISRKTASLIATSLALGARSVNTSQSAIDKMYEIGRLTGIAFQIKDDIFDYQQTNKIGKPTGNDIKEKKITLPLLYVIKNSDSRTKRYIYKTLRKNKKTQEDVSSIIELVNQRGGIEYATAKMEEFVKKATDLLKEFDPGDARDALLSLIRYTIDRKK